mmetsp:Transcript_7550/g.23477  ORF Transcript_7550/g.23477 Transcript_7550/m.23477 type:complete len:80 (-) Transcript_7550:275-514(-)
MSSRPRGRQSKCDFLLRFLLELQFELIAAQSLPNALFARGSHSAFAQDLPGFDLMKIESQVHRRPPVGFSHGRICASLQ